MKHQLVSGSDREKRQRQRWGDDMNTDNWDSLARVWSNILNKKVVKEGEGGRLWRFEDGSNWMGGVPVMLNRKCYDRVIERTKLNKKLLVRGTSGIGLTMFLERLLVEIAETHAQGLANRPFPYIIYSEMCNGEPAAYWLHPAGIVARVAETSLVNVDYYLSDGVDAVRPIGGILHIQVASLNRDSCYVKWENAVSRCSPAGLYILIPNWSLGELVQIRGNMSLEEARMRHSIIGGNPQLFIADCHQWRYRDYDHKLFRVIANELVRFCQLPTLYDGSKQAPIGDFGKAGTALHKNVIDVYSRIIASELRYRRWRDRDCNIFLRFFGLLITKFATSAMSFLALEMNKLPMITRDRAHENWVYLRHVRRALNVASGHYFFTCCTEMTKILAKQLTKDEYDSVGIEIALKLPIVRFADLLDIKNLDPGCYGLPIEGNFSFVDAIVQPNLLIRISESPTQYSRGGGLERLSRIRQQLLEPDQTKHKLLFMVSLENIGSFEYFDELAHIQQYVATYAPIESIISLYNQREWNLFQKVTVEMQLLCRC